MEDSHKKNGFSSVVRNSIYSFFSNEYTFFIFMGILIGFLAGLANFAFVEAYSFLYASSKA